MKMKKLNYIIPFLVAAFVMFTGCNEDLLDIEQKGVIDINSFYQTDEDAEQALVAMYADFITNIGGNDGIYVPYNILFNYPADNVLAAGNEYGDNDQFARINEFRYDAQSNEIYVMYRRFYFVIYHANLIIDNFEYGTSPTIDRAISEARVVRAWCHMKAAMLWGTPPLIDRLLGPSEKPSNFEGTHQELLEWCAKEAGEAAQYLDERQSIADKEGAVKVTKGWAWTVEGQAYLYAANYEKAKTALKKVIDSGKYALVPGEEWGSLFHIEGDGSPEKVFELNIVENTNIGEWSGKIQRSTWMEANLWGWRTDRLNAQPIMQRHGGWGGLAIERDFAHEFAAHDGDSHRRKATMLSYHEFITEIEWPSDGGDINNLTEAQKLADPNRGIRSGDGLYGQSEYLQRKFIVSNADVMNTYGFRFNNFIITRYADVLLMYAEACAMTTDDGSGLQALQEVQTRAGAPVSATLTLEDVKRERNFELWMEGSRWIDMKRWNEFGKLANRGKNIPTLRDKFEYDEDNEVVIHVHEGYVTFSNPNDDAKVKYGFEDKHKWFPYPYNVTSINPNIEQNNGWN